MKNQLSKVYFRARSAITGRFVSRDYAEQFPHNTIVEKVKRFFKKVTTNVRVD